MKHELQFFMTETDEKEFVAAFIDQAAALERPSGTYWRFRLGSFDVEFTPSPRSANQIALGSIAVADYLDDIASLAEPAERLFKKMRTWIRKRYWNRLVAENVTIPGSSTPYRWMWLGPDARAEVKSGRIVLRTLLGGRIVVAEEPNKAPEPT